MRRIVPQLPRLQSLDGWLYTTGIFSWDEKIWKFVWCASTFHQFSISILPPVLLSSFISTSSMWSTDEALCMAAGGKGRQQRWVEKEQVAEAMAALLSTAWENLKEPCSSSWNLAALKYYTFYGVFNFRKFEKFVLPWACLNFTGIQALYTALHAFITSADGYGKRVH